MKDQPRRWRACLQGRERSDLLYIVWFCWGAALLLYVLGSDNYLWPVAPMPLVLLIWLMERVRMFGRKRASQSGDSAPAGTTVIAAGARFKGDLLLDGDLEVQGHVNGTIEIGKGVLRIMQGGFVEGEVSAPRVVINGLLDGTCSSQEVEILENGRMQGVFKGGTLSIRKGGNFIGHSQPAERATIEPPNNPLPDSKSSKPKAKEQARGAGDKVAETLVAQA
ncbi:bactofilin family protein [Aeromonas enteropelogenes]|uniref:Polymer-forming cytoskeletal protein n=1 Tax=Aeromonas enteropelogenes TaxID=29489 RepID=A0A175VJ55_AEREN|nr:polymer-forming cytoskeletal protein [Aeromonas enteropelogenes]KXU80745.1 hypothetical protein LCR_11700 [Aeromonas enteropelogenes]